MISAVIGSILALLLAASPAPEFSPHPAARAATQQGSTTSSSDKTQNDKVGANYEVVVTATRTEVQSRELGRATTVITAEEIEAQGARTVQQVLETVPGFDVVRSGSFGGTTSLFVRGGESDFNLVLIDGIPVNQAGGEFDLADLTTANIERIEIVRGPSTVLYGAESVTSTINIITHRGEGRPGGALSAEGGSFDSLSLNGNVHGSLDRVSYAFGGLYSRSGGIFDFNNRYKRGEVSGALGIELNSTAAIETTLRFSDSEFQIPTSFFGAPVDPNDFSQADELLVSVSYRARFNSTYSTRVQYGFHRRDLTSFNLADDVDDFFGDSIFKSIEDRNYVDWQNDFKLGQHNLVTAGLSMDREQSDSLSSDRRSVGFYLQDQFSWEDRLFLTAGLRHDNNDRFENFTVGSFSAALLLNDEIKVRASLGNGFRSPSFAEIVGFPDFGIIGSENLVPEKNISTDFGLDFADSAGRLRFSGTVFFNRFSDLIEFSFNVPPGSPNYVNIEKAESQGIELEGRLGLTERLRLGGNYTLTQTEVTDAGSDPGGNFLEGEPLLRRPRRQANIFAELIRNRYHFRIDFKFKGRRDDRRFFSDFSSQRVELPSYGRLISG